MCTIYLIAGTCQTPPREAGEHWASCPPPFCSSLYPLGSCLFPARDRGGDGSENIYRNLKGSTHSPGTRVLGSTLWVCEHDVFPVHSSFPALSGFCEVRVWWSHWVSHAANPISKWHVLIGMDNIQLGISFVSKRIYVGIKLKKMCFSLQIDSLITIVLTTRKTKMHF